MVEISHEEEPSGPPDTYTYSNDSLITMRENVGPEVVYLCGALKSGLRVEDLSPEDNKILLDALGPDWFAIYERYYLSDKYVEIHR